MVLCFQHPNYKGKDAPDISCKTCCHIFISEVKRCRDNGEPIPECATQKANFQKKSANIPSLHKTPLRANKTY